MRQGTKRYFCGCGRVVDGPGRYCNDTCLREARARATAEAVKPLIGGEAVFCGLNVSMRLAPDGSFRWTPHVGGGSTLSFDALGACWRVVENDLPLPAGGTIHLGKGPGTQ